MHYALYTNYPTEVPNISKNRCQNADNKNKTDILLSHEGVFIAFGEKALEQLCHDT